MKKAIASSVFGIVAMSLSACDGGTGRATPTISKAEGEILPRSVTDDMLPYDILQSQPPLAGREDGKTTGTAGSSAGRDGDTPSDGPAESQLSETPSQAGSQSQAMPGAE
jgi:hypothetical protein